MVKCHTCDLVYAVNPPSADELADSYHQADYDSQEEAEDAANAYELSILPVVKKLKNQEAALEIGTGTGVFLERLKNLGFETVVGIEPSSAAIAIAPESRRGWIIQDVFDEKKFQQSSFDLICCFMTMEHVRDPLALSKVFRL